MIATNITKKRCSSEAQLNRIDHAFGHEMMNSVDCQLLEFDRRPPSSMAVCDFSKNRFFSVTKFEEFENLHDARLSVFKYIETFYNSERIHQNLEYQIPDEVERKYRASSCLKWLRGCPPVLGQRSCETKASSVR